MGNTIAKPTQTSTIETTSSTEPSKEVFTSATNNPSSPPSIPPTSPPQSSATKLPRDDRRDPLLFLGAGALLGIIGGTLIFFFPHSYWALAAFPLAIFGRLVFSAIGLRVAKWQCSYVGITKKSTIEQDAANQDIASRNRAVALTRFSIIETIVSALVDAMMYLPLIFAPVFPPLTTLACVVLGIVSELAAQLMAGTNGTHNTADETCRYTTAIADARRIGPITRTTQAIVFGALALLIAAGFRSVFMSNCVIGALKILLFVTIIRRTLHTVNATSNEKG